VVHNIKAFPEHFTELHGVSKTVGKLVETRLKWKRFKFMSACRYIAKNTQKTTNATGRYRRCHNYVHYWVTGRASDLKKTHSSNSQSFWMFSISIGELTSLSSKWVIINISSGYTAHTCWDLMSWLPLVTQHGNHTVPWWRDHSVRNVGCMWFVRSSVDRVLTSESRHS